GPANVTKRAENSSPFSSAALALLLPPCSVLCVRAVCGALVGWSASARARRSEPLRGGRVAGAHPGAAGTEAARGQHGGRHGGGVGPAGPRPAPPLAARARCSAPDPQRQRALKDTPISAAMHCQRKGG